MKIALWLILEVWQLMQWLSIVHCQINRAPHFILGGDMARFSISEDTTPGTVVYTLRGADPEFTNVYYSISGLYLNVNKYTGNVTLIKALDREAVDLIEVIISITDEPIYEAEANTVSIKREIPVLDVNDNTPEFIDQPYYVSIPENTKPGTILYSNITVVDKDIGLNAQISLSCISQSICHTFSVSETKVSEGVYKGIITLLSTLDYEVQSSYSLSIKATDSNPKNRLSSTATVAIEIQDIQDQPPVFIGTPYFVSIPENTPPGYKVLNVEAKDGDVKNPRSITFSIENDRLKHFKLINYGNGSASIVTSNVTIDKEHPFIVGAGCIYTFNVKAVELINNQLPGDESSEFVTINILDVDDQLPYFNSNFFKINISEDIGKGTSLPGLDMVVQDDDDGENGRFFLSLKSVVIDQYDNEGLNFKEWFSVEPTTAFGRTTVVIRLTDNSDIDFDNNIRNIQLVVIASVNKNGSLTEVSSSVVEIGVFDVNDNVPTFHQKQYVIRVKEDTSVGTKVADITAEDNDSGVFADVSYSLSGFGTDKFRTDVKSGGITLVNKLDYEMQGSYTLVLKATDGGGRSSFVDVFISVDDVNDNYPIFEQEEYRRIVREGFVEFHPRLFVKATDADSVDNAIIVYTIEMTNFDIVNINKRTGEITFAAPASSKHTPKSQYELRIRATDSGTPALFAETTVLIRVGIPGNQKPVFHGTPYEATIPETALCGMSVITVTATDPDGPTDHIEYRMISGADNFNIDSKSGLITVSEEAILDVDLTQLDKYELTILAVDKGIPFPETAEATVSVNIKDVNNKVPYFPSMNTYVCRIFENSAIDGEPILKVEALDPDSSAQIRYKIIPPISVIDKRGFQINEDLAKDFQDAFVINENTGEIKLNSPIDYHIATAVIISVEAVDKNATVDVQKQSARVNVTLYIETNDALKPKFITSSGWSFSNPVVEINLPEESYVGFIILQLYAVDTLTGNNVTYFKASSIVPKQFFINYNGSIGLSRRIDYETMNNHTLDFFVEAFSNDNRTRTRSQVIINVIDINDHTPQFRNKSYHASISENAKVGTVVTTVTAVDLDLDTSPFGFGIVRYSLVGEHSFLFKIDSVTGVIKVSNADGIDRERISVLRMVAVANDMPQGGINQRRTSVPITIDVLDVNDNAPVFTSTVHSAVVLENVAPDTSILNITAKDLDYGLSAQVNYRIITGSDISDYLFINSSTGEIKTIRHLIGKGRREPYSIIIRAEDNGEPMLFTDSTIDVVVSDITVNDGIPMFIRPTLDEVVYLPENCSVNSFVFHVKATDSDDPHTPQGTLQYLFLEDGTDAEAFHIDTKSGLITTKHILDRETKDHYYLVLIAKDSAVLPQQATRVLHIVVTDVDDNLPVLRKSVDDSPIRMSVEEEVPIGTVVGYIKAHDADLEHNAIVGFLIIDGNNEGLFEIEETSEKNAVIKVSSHIDRETMSLVTLVVKCFRFSEKPSRLRNTYNKHDLSEREVIVKIIDVDDNAPEFQEQAITIGVRSNIQLDALLLSVNAVDADVTSGPVVYEIRNCSFVFPSNKTVTRMEELPFNLDNESGEVHLLKSLEKYANGYFNFSIMAFNGGLISNRSYIYIKMSITYESSFFKFVLDMAPSEFKKYTMQFINEMEEALKAYGLKFNAYSSRFYSYQDGAVDLFKTSSCFQVVSEIGSDASETESVLKNTEINLSLQKVYDKFNVESVQHCEPNAVAKRFTWVHISLAVVVFILVIMFSLISCFIYWAH